LDFLSITGQVLGLAREGLGRVEIADRLDISRWQVGKHFSLIRELGLPTQYDKMAKNCRPLQRNSSG